MTIYGWCQYVKWQSRPNLLQWTARSLPTHVTNVIMLTAYHATQKTFSASDLKHLSICASCLQCSTWQMKKCWLYGYAFTQGLRCTSPDVGCFSNWKHAAARQHAGRFIIQRCWLVSPAGWRQIDDILVYCHLDHVYMCIELVSNRRPINTHTEFPYEIHPRVCWLLVYRVVRLLLLALARNLFVSASGHKKFSQVLLAYRHMMCSRALSDVVIRTTNFSHNRSNLTATF